jgi:gamma-tubulin complex component 2
MLFRHLFKCKYLERCLSTSWLEGTKGIDYKALSALQNLMITQIFALRGKMLHFIQQVVYFMFFDVIDPRWRSMEVVVREAKTVESLLERHDDFLDTCLKECMLTNPKLIAILSSLITTCHLFITVSGIIVNDISGEPLTLEAESFLNDSEPKEYVEHLKGLEKSFLLQIHSLMECIQVLGVAETARLSSLVSQLDFNSYYSSLPPTADFILNPILPAH